MKKFLAIVFALIFALSCAAPAFAAMTCPYCDAILQTEAAYNKHISEECEELFGNNQGAVIYYCDYAKYGCTARFTDESNYEKHLELCAFKKETWGDKVEAFFLDLDYDDFTEVLDKITEALVGVGFPGLVVKLIDLLEQGVTALIGEIA